MKRIAIFQDNLDVGGIQKSLVNLLQGFDYENYQVDLYLSSSKSFWNTEFPKELNIKYLRHIPRICSFIPFDIARHMASLDFSDCGEYDLAIDYNSYQFSCALGALTVPAKRRVMWIHNDVEIKLQNEWKYRILWYNFKDKFKYYDEFVAVSEALIRPFKECSGYYDKKYSVIQNTINTREIELLAREETELEVDPNKLNFVAVGRLCHQKGYDIMLDCFAEACEKRDDLHLYIIGDGDKRFSLEYQRDSLGLTDKVTFLGRQTNPFKFMRRMDAFISTSRYEGQGMNIMEAKAVGLPLYCTKNLEQYAEGFEGYEDITSAISCAVKREKRPNPLTSYNNEILRRVKALAEPVNFILPPKTIHIIALHLGVGGVEKAIAQMANLFVSDYNVDVISVYNIPGSPAFNIDKRVYIKYLLADIPNKAEWKQAARDLNIRCFFSESVRAVKILLNKKLAVIRTIHSIHDGIIITTRNEDNVVLSRYGSKKLLKIAQLHHDHRFDKKLMRDIRYRYGNVDVFALLTPQLVDEAAQMMKGVNRHTRLVYMPNFLEHFPTLTGEERREKTVLAAGRLTEVKRFDLLIREFVSVHALRPDWKLRILGEGEDREMLEKLIADSGAGGYITLAGRKDAQEVESEMLGASIYAMTSRSEGFPFVLMEAQSCALPIIAFDVRVGPAFIVHDGQDGYIVPEGDDELFINRMCEMMDSRELRERMGRCAVDAVSEFSRDKVAEKWRSVIEA